MRLRLIRNATVQLHLHGTRMLLDPMLSPKGRFPPLTLGASSARNPLLDLPCPLEEIIRVDGVIVTHCHFDHFDHEASAKLHKHLPLFCQPSDAAKLRRRGFRRVLPVEQRTVWQAIDLLRVGGCHGHGMVRHLMGNVSGFVLRASGEPTVYIAGDTVWCPAVEETLAREKPDVIVVNAGGARFNVGSPIIMDATDVATVCRMAPQARVIAVHLEAIDHCRLNRQQLAQQMAEAHLAERVVIPADGESVTLPSC